MKINGEEVKEEEEEGGRSLMPRQNCREL